MAESLESLVQKFRQNLTEKIQKLEEETHEKKATLEAKHQQEMALIDVKEKIEKEEFDAKQSQRRKHLAVKHHQEKEKLKKDYDKNLKATMANEMCPNKVNQEAPECPVCLEPMDPPMRIFQCSNGHYLCEDCNNNMEIKSCPTCRRQIVGRNIGMEQAIELMGASTNDIPGSRQNQLKPRGNVWECSTCTFHNPEDKFICQMCGKIMVQPRATEGQNYMVKNNPNHEANKLSIFAMKPVIKENYHCNIVTLLPEVTNINGEGNDSKKEGDNKFEEGQKWDRNVDKQTERPETKLSNSKTSSIDLIRQRKPAAQFPRNRLADSSKGNGSRLANSSKGNVNILANSSKGNGIRNEKLHCPSPPYCPNCLNIVKMKNL